MSEPTPDSPLERLRALFWDARKAWRRNAFEDAMRLLNEAQSLAESQGWEADRRVFDALCAEFESRHADGAAIVEQAVGDDRLQLRGEAWLVAGSHYRELKHFDRAVECCQEALDTPGFDAPGSAWNNMAAAYLGKREYDRTIECFQRALDSPDYEARGNTWSNMGVAYSDKGEHDRAIECYEKALETPGYEAPSKAWSYMGVAYAEKGEHDRAIECVQKALDTPGFDSPGKAWYILGDAYGEKGEHDRAIECFRKALDTPGFDSPGGAWNGAGLAFYGKGEPDRAIDCYEKALDVPGYDAPGHAWTNMGNAYGEKGEPDRAIECYRKALDTPGFDSPGKAWNNMGNAYAKKGEHDRAIECYQMALKTPGYGTLGAAWNNMGNVYGNKGEHDRAIECYQKALDTPDFDTPGAAWFNMGNAYNNKGEHHRAIESYQKAVDAYRQSGDYDSAARMEEFIKALRLPANQRSVADQELVVATMAEPQRSEDTLETPEGRMQAKVLKAERDSYERYNALDSQDRSSEFAVLRGWSSTSPLVVQEVSDCRGGGYFFTWAGSGIIIDPGHDFLRNFHAAGYHLRDVDAVVVSHNHGDHNQDLKAVDDLFYEMWKRTRDREPAARGETPLYSYTLVWDTDSARHIQFEPPKADYRSELTYDFARLEQGMEDAIRLTRPKSLPLEIRYFRVKHSPDVPDAVGLRINCLDAADHDSRFVIGYSADTGYFDELCEDAALGHCDLLIAHVSQPDQKDYSNPNHRKKHHLGYRGTAALINGAKPKLTIVGEFWAGLADLRIDLVQGLRTLCGTNAILPGSQSLRVWLPSLEVVCTNCGRAVPVDSIHVAPPQMKFGPLNYLCDRCRLS
jgi:tetratricopeptide (TPR) repeat protein/ribonuclease BN (tRNA processing enzyme)